MPFGKKNKMPTRDLGLRSAGKGDKNRANAKAFREGYAGIDFGRQWKHPFPSLGFFQRGQRLIKTYKSNTNPT